MAGECNIKQMSKIVEWEKEIIVKLANKNCVFPKTLKDCLKKKLGKKGSKPVIIKCGSRKCSRCPGLKGHSIKGGNIVTICHGAFSSSSSVVLMHELIHSCGGDEFDSEIFENICYTRKEGATPPTKGDRQKFMRQGKSKVIERRKHRIYKWLIWNIETGDVWINTGTAKNPNKGPKVWPR